MKVLVVGASGATGKQLVNQLLLLGCELKVIVRSTASISDSWVFNKQITIIKAGVSELSKEEMADYLNDCQAVVSCLGHNMNFKGIFRHPRKLVTEAIQLICDAIEQNAPLNPVKVVLMNSVGNSNRDLNEAVSISQKALIILLRIFLPPHSDNENAADYLRLKISRTNKFIEWVAVRPDSLIDREVVSDYEIFESPVRSVIFNPGNTSRINVGNFMARLILEKELWNEWKGRMPVIYNKDL